MARVVMVLSGTKVWTMKDGTPHPTGFWSEEFVTPHRTFTQAGHDVSVATPGGVAPTVDPLSFSLGYNNNDAELVRSQQEYMKKLGSLLEKPLALEGLNAADHTVLFLVGGHGPMQDMAVNPAIGPLLIKTLDDPRKVVASVCHGPAGFLSAARPDGTWLFKDRELTGFSNEEESQATFAGNAPWLLEDRLRLAGARYVAKKAWTPYAHTDGNLVTGQQNYSAGVTADAVLARLAANA